MKVSFILDTPMPMFSGIWFHRVKMPSEALGTRGHFIRQWMIGKMNEDNQKLIDETDVAIFGRTYPQGYDPVGLMRSFKAAGKRVIYDIDDDIWQIDESNPSVLIGNALKDQYEDQIRECDAVITPSHELAKKIRKHFKKPVFICPNAINFNSDYKDRPRHNQEVTIGYMGASSHWKDINLVVDVLEELSKKHTFFFYLYGLTASSIESDAYTANLMLQMNAEPEKEHYLREITKFYSKMKNLRMVQKPFMPPEIHPMHLANCDFDIGIAPLEDTEFNRGKSCIKYYEYAATGTATLSSDVEPYKSEVTYRAKNTHKDWYEKLEKLIVDKEFRDKIQKEQTDWVKKNRSIEVVALDWELALQKPAEDSPGVINQVKKIFKRK